MRITAENSIGGRIRDKRKKLGLTQEMLAECLHVRRATVSNWEANTSEPDITSLKAMSVLFSCDVAYLIGEINAERIGGQVITNRTGMSVEAVNKIIRMNNEIDNRLFEQVILSPFFQASLEALGVAILDSKPVDRKQAAERRNKSIKESIEESKKRGGNPFLDRMANIVQIAEESGDYDKMISFLNELTSQEEITLPRKEYVNFQLQQSFLEFQKCINQIFQNQKGSDI